MKLLFLAVLCLTFAKAQDAPLPNPPAKVYLVGNVKKPGIYDFENAKSVMSALAKAGGVLPSSSNKLFIYRRAEAKTARKEIIVNLARILERRDPDLELQANDVLYLPADHTRMGASRSPHGPKNFPLPNDWPTNVRGD